MGQARRWRIRTALLNEARPYCNEKGRVIRMMPPELLDKLRKAYLAIGVEMAKPDPELGTRARWFVLFPDIREGILQAADKFHAGELVPDVLTRWRLKRDAREADHAAYLKRKARRETNARRPRSRRRTARMR